MIARIIAGSARNMMLVLIGTAFAVPAGIYAVLHTPLDALPDLSDTQVIVYTEYPGQATYDKTRKRTHQEAFKNAKRDRSQDAVGENGHEWKERRVETEPTVKICESGNHWIGCEPSNRGNPV